MKSKLFLFLIPLLMLSGCTAKQQQPDAYELPTTSKGLQVNNTSDDIWDAFIERNGDSIDAL